MKQDNRHTNDHLEELLNGFHPEVPAGSWDRLSSSLESADNKAGAFDEALNNRLQSYSAEPPANTWTQIEKDLPGRRRFAFWWWAAVVALISVAGYLVLRSDKPQTADNNNTAIASESRSSVVDDQSSNTRNRTAEVPEQKETPANIDGSQANGQGTSKSGRVGSSVAAAVSGHKSSSASIDPEKPSANSPKPLQNSAEIGELLNFGPARSVSALNASPFHYLAEKLSLVFHADKRDELLKGGREMSAWQVGATASAAAMWRTLAINQKYGKYVHRSYLDLREKGESAAPSAFASVRIQREIGRFTLQTGVGISTAGWQQRYNYTIDSIPVLMKNKPEVNGQYEIGGYLGPLGNPEQVNLQATARLIYLDIPLNLRYRMLSKNGFTASALAGSGISRLLATEGNAIDMNTLKLTALNRRDFASTLLSVRAGVAADWQVSRHWSFGAEFVSGRMIGALSDEKEIVKTRPVQNGLNFSVMYHITGGKRP